MGRMVKCAFTGKIADSSCLYKVGSQWFEDKDTYIKYLKSNAKFNVLAMGIIYIVLSFIELCRYGIIVYSIYLVSIGNMEIGTILLIYSYYAKIITNFEVLGTINAEYQSVKVSVNRLNSLHTEIE